VVGEFVLYCLSSRAPISRACSLKLGDPQTNQVDKQMTDPKMSHLVPAALAIRPKTKNEPPSPLTKRTSLFANARDSMNWGIKELTGAPLAKAQDPASVIRSKEPAIPENFTMPPPRSTRKRNFSSGKHPLKSPFPFYTSRKNSYPEESESKLSKRLSGAMKRLSGGKSSPTKTTTIISNSARAPNGPDTPIPMRSGNIAAFAFVDPNDTVHHGNEHLAEVYARAKESLKIKTGDERRRESLKKKIVVVGITDQSPGNQFFFPNKLPTQQTLIAS